MICECLHTEYGEEVCWGTRERDLCSCGGDRNKCDFYTEKKKSLTDEEELKMVRQFIHDNGLEFELANYFIGRKYD